MTRAIATLEEIFSPVGLLSKAFSLFEERKGQREMSQEVWEAFEHKSSALIEAGTGIGKTLAYLIPALLWIERIESPIVISTYTLALQQQLIDKDIPSLAKALGLSPKIVVAKGMGNYLCLRHLDEQRLLLVGGESYQELWSWASDSSEGSRHDFPLSDEIWQKVNADKNSCHFARCPHYRECFFFKARKKLIEADLIIVNHHLLMADLIARNERGEEGAILPAYRHLILDEAHHLEEVARSSLAARFDAREVLGALAHVHSDIHPESSRFKMLGEELVNLANQALLQRLSLELPAERRTLVELLREMTDAAAALLEGRFSYRIDQEKEPFFSCLERLKEQIQRYAAALNSLEKEVRALTIETRPAKIETALVEIGALAERLEKWKEIIKVFMEAASPRRVRFLKREEMMPELVQAELEIGERMKEELFSKLDTAILCSATLSLEGSFSYLKEQLGALGSERIYPSPFNFKERVFLCVPTDLPLPGEPGFPFVAAQVCAEAIQASGGGAFVLFTSYEMLLACKEFLIVHLKNKFSVFEQGTLSRDELLRAFKASGNGVLLGTDSFWEGVDVPGHALRLVVIMRLPFPVPNDPIFEARGEWLKSQGRNPFVEDALPRAAVKLKQGFGRLMRTSRDWGGVLCLDHRLVTRPYGKRLLTSLPECRMLSSSKQQVINSLKIFYQNGA